MAIKLFINTIKAIRVDNIIRATLVIPIVFPLSSVGNKVFVEGEFSKLIFSEDQAKQWKIHLAEEKGQILDPDSVIIKDSDLVEYRIIGKGAEIYPL